MRARPDQTQLEDLLHASFLGKLLVLPANVRLDWKVFARCKHSSLFGLTVSNEEKERTPGDHFENVSTLVNYNGAAAAAAITAFWGQFYITFYGRKLRIYAIS